MYRRAPEEKLIVCNDPPKMEFDEACLIVTNALNTSFTIKRQYVECYQCDMMSWRTIEPEESIFLAVDIADSFKFGVDWCEKTHNFQQHGIYAWVIDTDCKEVEEIQPPDLAYTPLLILLGTVLVCCVMYSLIKLSRRFEVTRKIINKLRRPDHKDGAESDVSDATTIGTRATTQTSDVISLPVPQIFCIQVFRGLVILSMLVFYGESDRYWFLRNSSWNGIMPADFVYPWFLWGVGAVFYLKYRSSLLTGSSRLKVVGEVTLRTLKYVLLGVCLNSFENNDNPYGMRLPGELQRSGALHFVIFVVEITRMKKEVMVDEICAKKLPDSWVQYTFVILCLVVHAMITYLLPVPDCPTGYTGPGGLHMHLKYQNCTGGAAGYIDSLVFGDDNLDQYPACQPVYKTYFSFDSAGLLGTLNCVLTMFSGVYAAEVFVYHSKTKVRLIILVVCGVVQSFLGCLFCLFSKEGGLPLNKQLWSLSFALLTSGTAFLVLALLHVLVDVTSLWLGSPLFEAGLNTMLIYTGHAVLRFSLPFSWTPISEKQYTEFVIMDVVKVGFWIFVSRLAYKHKRVLFI